MVGWVPSVLPYLNRARVTVIPLLYGAGTKRKLIQALMAGTPSVSTAVGIPGGQERDARICRSGGDRRRRGEVDGLRSAVDRLHSPGPRGRARHRRSESHRDRRRSRSCRRELAVPRWEEPRPDRRGGFDLVRSAEALPEAFLSHTARQRVHPGERRVPRYYRWPLLDRRAFTKWCESTGWGQLFLRYAQMGPQGQPLDLRTPAETAPARLH